METSNSSSATDKLAQQLAHDPHAFFSERFSFSWWLRGGEPGSPSDKLTLEGDRGSIRGAYVRARFDLDREPPNYSETFTGAIELNHASAIMRRLFDGPLFREQLKEESDRGMRDVQKETWTFTQGDAHYSKTLFEPLPVSIEGVRILCRELMQQLVRAGRR